MFDTLLKASVVSRDRLDVEVIREAPGNEAKNPWPGSTETAIEEALGCKPAGFPAGTTEIGRGGSMKRKLK